MKWDCFIRDYWCNEASIASVVIIIRKATAAMNIIKKYLISEVVNIIE